MIKAEVNRGTCSLDIYGDLMDIIADYLHLINKLYNVVNEKQPKAAKLLKNMMQKAIVDENSHVWDIDERMSSGPSKIGIVQLKGTESKEQVAQCLATTLRSMGVPEEDIARMLANK